MYADVWMVSTASSDFNKNDETKKEIFEYLQYCN